MIEKDQMAWARRLKVKHLESFLVLDEAGTLTEAASRMHMTQSAMSHWLADLEETVGMPLVIRGHRSRIASPKLRSTVLGLARSPRVGDSWLFPMQSRMVLATLAGIGMMCRSASGTIQARASASGFQLFSRRGGSRCR